MFWLAIFFLFVCLLRLIESSEKLKKVHHWKKKARAREVVETMRAAFEWCLSYVSDIIHHALHHQSYDRIHLSSRIESFGYVARSITTHYELIHDPLLAS